MKNHFHPKKNHIVAAAVCVIFLCCQNFFEIHLAKPNQSVTAIEFVFDTTLTSLSYVSVDDIATEEIVWQMWSDYRVDVESNGLFYGEVPDGFFEEVSAQDLQAGHSYTIHVSDSNSGSSGNLTFAVDADGIVNEITENQNDFN